MNLRPSFEIKWYHILFGLLGIGLVVFAVLHFYFGPRRLSYFHEDKTDIVDVE